MQSPSLSQLPFQILLCLFFYYCLYVIIVQEFRRATRASTLLKQQPGGSHGPPCYPILGSFISFYKNRHRLLDWYTDLLSLSPTQTIVVTRFGASPTIVTANPQNVEYILKTNFSNYPKGKAFTQILGDFLGNGIFNVDGDLWHIQRSLANHVFNTKSFRRYALDVLKEGVESKLLPVLAAATTRAVDLQDLLRRFGFDVVCKATLGVDPCALSCYSNGQQPPPSSSSIMSSSSSLIEAFDKASEISAKRGAAPVSATWKAKKLLGIGSERTLKESIHRIHAFVSDIIRHKLNISSNTSSPVGEDLLSNMIASNIRSSDHINIGSEEEFLRDMMISFIMAGRDTTSAAMTWFFYLLSANPDVEQDVIKELLTAKCPDEDQDQEQDKEDVDGFSHFESLKDLRLLKACLCESMRLYPPVAWDSKHAITDDLLPDGTPIRAGDRVTYFPYGMGRMECLWGEDRLQFRPERWVLERNQQGTIGALKNVGPYRFPVFQAGPRVCLGKELAFIQMKYVVGSILKKFEIRPATSNPPVFVPFLTAHMAGGFKVIIRRRRGGQHV